MKYLDMILSHTLAAPERVAVRNSAGEQMTYGELWGCARAIAAELDSRTSAQDRSPVIVYGNKSPLMVAGFLACMMSGRPYVPIDRFSVPPERVDSIAKQLTAPLVIETGRSAEVVFVPASTLTAPGEFMLREGAAADALHIAVTDVLGPATLELLAEKPALPGAATPEASPKDLDRAISGEDVCYILFTSGSTGAPKGVEVTAACFDNFCTWDLTLGGGAQMLDGLTWIDQAPFSFDLSVFELAGALAGGGTLYSLTHGVQQSAAALLEALAGSGAVVWVSTPSFASLCLANPRFGAALMPSVRCMLFCGEALPNKVAASLMERFPAARVVNTYGPTESTVAVTSVKITPQMAAEPAPLPVGTPRPGTRLRIVDDSGADVPRGTWGEVVIEGDTVAAGYHGRRDLTERAFSTVVPAAKTRDAVRAYRTGDEGRLDEHGMLHYRGRIDLQVKLNGYRIELGEIEEHLRRLAGVKAAVVVPAERDGRITHLVAYVVPGSADAPRDTAAGLAIKERLKEALPHYMIPRTLRFIDAVPMTPNGKVDRRALEGRTASRRRAAAPVAVHAENLGQPDLAAARERLACSAERLGAPASGTPHAAPRACAVAR